MLDILEKSKSTIRMADGVVADGAEIIIEKSWEGNLLTTRVVNQSAKPLRVKEVVLFACTLPCDPDTPFYGEGYQMLAQYAGTLAEPCVIGAYGTDEDFFRIPKTEFNAGLWSAYNLMMLSPKESEHILMAFTSCRRFSGEFRFNSNYLEIIMDTENLQLEPGVSWELEEFMISSGPDCNELFKDLAERLNKNHPRMIYPEIPSGWCSYYCLRPVTAAALIDNARSMAERIPELKRVQIDGGYEATNGDWLIPNPELGADMKTVSDRIRRVGVEAAGYLSPFIVAQESRIFREHPDWLVRDEAGQPFNKIGRVSNWYMLDGSHPAVRDHFRRLIRKMHDEWGWRYFKLDFLAYGALPGGCRYDRKATRIEAFRRGVQAIVAEVGADSFILGCNAPFWPILGLVHGNRVTNDIYRDWKHVAGNARELFYRNWQNNALWVNDPDCVLLESLDLPGWKNGQKIIKKSTLTANEFEFHKACSVASGGMILSGDLIPTLSAKNLGILKKMLATTGVAARFDDAGFTVGRIERREYQVLCIFNWDEHPKDITVNLDGSCQIEDFWTEEKIGIFRDVMQIKQLGPHSARILICKSSK